MAGGDIVNVDGRIYNPRLWVGELVTMTLAAAAVSRSSEHCCCVPLMFSCSLSDTKTPHTVFVVQRVY